MYFVSITLASKADYLADDKDKVWFMKNEELARNYEDLFSKRSEKTEVEERDGVLHIISPVQGIG